MSITQEQFDEIRKIFGKVCSWAVWRMPEPGDKPLAYIDDLTEIQAGNVHNRAVFVSLNPSRSLRNKPDFANFHDADAHSHDYSLRRALEGSSYSGALMIDFVTDFENPDSDAAMKRIKSDRAYYKKCMERVMEVLHLLADHSKRLPVIVAMGRKAHALLTDSYDARYGGECDIRKCGYPVYRITHYAASVSDERKKIEIRNLPSLFADCNDMADLIQSYHLGKLKCTPLNEKKARQMIQELKSADEETHQRILNHMIASALPAIEKTAEKFSGYGPGDHLLLLAGVKGFVCAVEHYDGESGVCFHPYMRWYVKQYMRKLIAEYKNDQENP